MRTLRFAILMLVETVVLLALIHAGSAVPPAVAVAVVITLVVLAMVVGGAARHIPATLHALVALLRRHR